MTSRSRLAVLASLALSAPAGALAQEPLPAVLPEVLFLVEDSARMSAAWDGDPSLTVPATRWSYVRDAIIQVIQNAPLDMTFGVALTADGAGPESDGFHALAYPGMDTAAIVAALNAHVPSTNSSRQTAESYSALLDNWAERPYATPRSWNTGPFRYYCSALIVIVIGTDVGLNDGNPSSGYYTTSPPFDVGCNDPSGNQGCFADNVAHFAWNNFTAPLAGTGSVTTHAILVDSASPTIGADGAALYTSMAIMGQGMYYGPTVPGGVATSIWGALTDGFQGEYSNAAVSMSPAGDRLFTAWYEVQGGHPLYKGHLLAWQVENNPNAANYGEVVNAAATPSGSTLVPGSLWDAGLRLASREAFPSENNQGAFDPADQRNGYTAAQAETFFSDPIPFDASQLGAGTDLTQLLIDEVPDTSNPLCLPLPHDFDYDCDSDFDDAQLLVDFVRGVSTATFLHTGLPRTTWRLGDTGHSIAVAAPASTLSISSEMHFQAYTERLADVAGMVYVASNAGMLHAFNLDNAASGHPGSEYWFYVPRAKATWDPTASTVREYDGFQVDDLMRSGQTYVNEGQLVVDHAWLDGYSNGLGEGAIVGNGIAETVCTAPGYHSGMDDGLIDPEGCEWHRVVVWTGGYGARHVYALAVSNPQDPIFLWERNDTNGNTGPGRGRAVGSPGLVSFFDRSNAAQPANLRWLAVWSSGSQSPGVTAASGASNYAHAAVYIHDLDSNSSSSLVPTVYPESGFTIPHPALSSIDSDAYSEYVPPEYGLFGTPALADLDADGSVDVGYIGDSLGYVFKVKFNDTNPSSPSRCLFASPNSSDEAKHIYYQPAVFYNMNGELLVYYGSGSPYNIYDAVEGGVYVRKDPNPFGCAASVAAPCVGSSALFNAGGFMVFTGTGEKLVGPPTVVFGRMFWATHIPGSDPCVLGNSRLYGLNVETCTGGIFDDPTDSFTVSSNLYTEVPGLISEPVFANGRIYALNLDGGDIDIDSVIDTFQPTPDDMVKFVFSSWRHVF